MEDNRKPNGQFGAGNRANPKGRPRKSHSSYDEVTRELNSKITITENGKRKRVTKLAANAKQIANLGASGELKAAKMTVDYALRAEKEREVPPAAQPLTQNDEEIVARFIARLKASVPRPDAQSIAEEGAPQSPEANDLNPPNKEKPDADAQP